MYYGCNNDLMVGVNMVMTVGKILGWKLERKKGMLVGVDVSYIWLAVDVDRYIKEVEGYILG